jgi:hypothetical protein
MRYVQCLVGLAEMCVLKSTDGGDAAAKGGVRAGNLVCDMEIRYVQYLFGWAEMPVLNKTDGGNSVCRVGQRLGLGRLLGDVVSSYRAGVFVLTSSDKVELGVCCCVLAAAEVY